MSRKRSKSNSVVPILIVVAAVAIWGFDAYKLGDFRQNTGGEGPQSHEAGSPSSSEKPARTGRYDTYTGCTLVPDRSNDGDSFRVMLPEGRMEIIRLYFVDSPESAFKTYGGGRNNHRRIGDQAADMGGITPQQAVEIGKKAKQFTLYHLEKNPFTLHTEWDSPFNDKRYHGFIKLRYNGKTVSSTNCSSRKATPASTRKAPNSPAAHPRASRKTISTISSAQRSQPKPAPGASNMERGFCQPLSQTPTQTKALQTIANPSGFKIRAPQPSCASTHSKPATVAARPPNGSEKTKSFSRKSPSVKPRHQKPNSGLP